MGIANEINTDADTNTVVSAVAVDNTLTPPAPNAGSNNEVVVTGLGNGDYAIDFTDDGTSVVAAVADPVSAELFMYVQRTSAPNTTANQKWRKTHGSYIIGNDGYIDRWNVAGLARMYARLGSVAGLGTDGSVVTLRDPDIDIAPCILEG